MYASDKDRTNRNHIHLIENWNNITNTEEDMDLFDFPALRKRKIWFLRKNGKEKNKRRLNEIKIQRKDINKNY